MLLARIHARALPATLTEPLAEQSMPSAAISKPHSNFCIQHSSLRHYKLTLVLPRTDAWQVLCRGEACEAGNLGPKPIPIDHFTKRRLVKALERMDDPEVSDWQLQFIKHTGICALSIGLVRHCAFCFDSRLVKYFHSPGGLYLS